MFIIWATVSETEHSPAFRHWFGVNTGGSLAAQSNSLQFLVMGTVKDHTRSTKPHLDDFKI